MTDYSPIDCGLYDRYEAWSTLRTRLRITHRDAHGGTVERIGRIADLVNDGAEWLVLDTGVRVRLDHIISAFVYE